MSLPSLTSFLKRENHSCVRWLGVPNLAVVTILRIKGVEEVFFFIRFENTVAQERYLRGGEDSPGDSTISIVKV